MRDEQGKHQLREPPKPERPTAASHTGMRIEDFENLPETISLDEVDQLLISILSEASGSSLQSKLEKLEILGDKQWHTYEPPKAITRQRLKEWILKNCDNEEVAPENYVEAALSLSYDFGLDKEFYRKLLAIYDGENREEFLHHLEKSSGPNIDPWWSLKEGKAPPAE